MLGDSIRQILFNLDFIVAVPLLVRALIVVEVFVGVDFVALKSASLGKKAEKQVVGDVPPYVLSLQPS